MIQILNLSDPNLFQTIISSLRNHHSKRFSFNNTAVNLLPIEVIIKKCIKKDSVRVHQKLQIKIEYI